MASSRKGFSARLPGRSVRVRLTVLLLSFTLIATSLTGMLIYRHTSRQLIADAWQQHETLLKAACSSINQQLEQLRSFSWQLSNDNSVQTLIALHKQDASSILEKQKLIARLLQMQAFSNTICDIGIYLNNLDQIVTSKSSSNSEDFYEYMEHITLRTMQAELQRTSSSKLCMFVGVDSVRRIMSSEKVLVFMSALPINAPSGKDFAFFHLQGSKVASFLTESQSSFMLLADNEGNALLGVTNDLTGALCKTYMENHASTIRYNGQEYGVLAMETDAQGLYCMAIMPFTQMFAQATEIRSLTMLIMGVCMLTGLLSATFFIKRMYAPLENLLQSIRQMGHALPHAGKADEYKLLDDAIHLISEENHTLSLSNQEVNRLLKNNLLGEWMEGRLKRNAVESLQQAQIILPYDRVQAAVIELSIRDAERLREAIGQNLADWVEEQQHTTDYGALAVWCAQRLDGCLLITFNIAADHPNPEWIYRYLEDCHARFSQLVSCQIGVGRSYHLEHISDSLVEAMLALRNGEQLGERNIYYAEEISMEPDTEYSLAAEQRLTNLVLGGQRDEVAAFLRTLGQSENGSYVLRGKLVQALLFTARRIAWQAGVNDSFAQQVEAAQAQLNEAPLSARAMEQLQAIYSALMDQLKVNASTQEEKLYARLMAYVQQEYVHNISLDTASEALSLSPSYIGLIFRKVGSTSFLKALNDIRVSKAKELLQNTELTIHEIGESVGVENQNTFIRMFKKAEGITPGQYRMAILHTEEQN